MKRLLTTVCTFFVIAAIAFFFAHLFVDGLLTELEIRDEHNKIHMRSRL